LAPNDAAHDRLERAEKAAEQAKDLTQQLLTFAKGGAPIKKSLKISEIIKDSIDFALHGSTCSLKLSIPKDLYHVKADQGQIGQVINNLAINSIQAMPHGGSIEVICENFENRPERFDYISSLTEEHYVKIIFRDQGTGIPPS